MKRSEDFFKRQLMVQVVLHTKGEVGMGKGTDTGLGQEVTEEGLIAALVDTEEEAKEVGLKVVTGKEGARVEANQMQRKRKAEARAKKRY